MNILQSASKIVFIMLAATACAGFLIGVTTPQKDDGLPIDQFMLLATGAFAFYFAKPNSPQDTIAGK